VYRVAFLGSSSPSGYASQLEASREGSAISAMSRAWNVIIEVRWAQENSNIFPKLAAETRSVEA